MAAYPIPKPQYGIYNQNNFSPQTTGQTGLTIDEGKKYFLTFPNAQTTQTEYLDNIGVGGTATFENAVIFNDTVTYNADIEFNQDVIVDGTATVGGNLLCDTTATISGTLTAETGIDISISGGITFPDNTTQTTAYNDTNVVQNDQANTFLYPFTQTFNGAVNILSSTGVSPTLSLFSGTIPTTIYQNGGQLSFNNSGTFASNSGCNFAFFNSSNNMSTVLNIASAGTNLYSDLSMNDNNITGINNLSVSSGQTLNIVDGVTNIMTFNTSGINSYETITMNGVNLNMNTNNITGIGALTGTGLGNITCNSPLIMGSGQSVNLNGNVMIGCASITRSTGYYVTTNTPPDGDDTGNIATTQFVQTAISGGVDGFAYLTSPVGLQTFTTPINFTSTLQYNSITVATTSQLPFYTVDTPISLAGPAGSITGQITANFPLTLQTTIRTPYVNSSNSTYIIEFLNTPIGINTNSYLNGSTSTYPVNTPLTFPAFGISFGTTNPWTGPWPENTTDFCYGTTNTGAGIQFTIAYVYSGNNYVIYFGYPYNLGNNISCIFSLSSIGSIVVY
jgi:hypothetical protein